MKLGIGSYTFPWAVGVRGWPPPCPMDENGLLDKACAYGVKVLQIGDNLPLHAFTPERLSRLAERAAALGIDLEVGARGLTVQRATDYFAIARRLGARLVRFVIDDAGYHPDPGSVAAILRELAPSLDGLVLGIENHDRFQAATLRQMIEDVGCDRVGVCLDTANSLGANEGLGAVLQELAPLAVNLHIKDFAIERVSHLMGFSVTGRPAGQGLLNVPELLDRLRPEGRCATAILELWPPLESTLKATIAKEASWADESVAYLRRIVH